MRPCRDLSRLFGIWGISAVLGFCGGGSYLPHDYAQESSPVKGRCSIAYKDK